MRTSTASSGPDLLVEKCGRFLYHFESGRLMYSCGLFAW